MTSCEKFLFASHLRRPKKCAIKPVIPETYHQPDALYFLQADGLHTVDSVQYSNSLGSPCSSCGLLFLLLHQSRCLIVIISNSPLPGHILRTDRGQSGQVKSAQRVAIFLLTDSYYVVLEKSVPHTVLGTPLWLVRGCEIIAAKLRQRW